MSAERQALAEDNTRETEQRAAVSVGVHSMPSWNAGLQRQLGRMGPHRLVEALQKMQLLERT